MTDNDPTMAAAADAFGKLGEAPPVEEPRDDEADDEGSGIPLDEGNAQDDTGQPDGDEPSGDEQQDEPASPAIDPPARWTDEQKKLWSGIPADAQREIAASFKDQERAIGAKSEEAAAARKASDAAISEAAQFARHYAVQLAEYARAFEPQRPDYGLLATDPQAYAQQRAAYEASMAQRNDLAQRSAQASQQAEAIQQQQLQAEQRQFHDTLAQAWGEDWTNADKRKVLVDGLQSVATELGYAPEVQGGANAADFMALRTAAEWKDKAGKWDQLQASKMQLVRDAKQKPKTQTPGVAQPRGSERTRGMSEAMTDLRKSGSVQDAAKAFARLG